MTHTLPFSQSRTRPRSTAQVAIWLAALVVVAGPVVDATAQDASIRFGSKVPHDVKFVYDRGLRYLVEHQDEGGAWGASLDSGEGGYPGVIGLAVMAITQAQKDYSSRSQSLEFAELSEQCRLLKGEKS